MEIKNTTLDTYRTQLERKPEARTREANARSHTSPVTESTGGDRVSVSRDAALRTEALKAAMSVPDVRQEKVSAIKERISNGEYQIDAYDIARNLLRADQMLLGKNV